MALAAHLVRPIELRSAHGSEEGRRVTWLELFFDLAFVAAVAQVGTPLATDYSPGGLLRYAILFLLLWWAWLGHTNFATRFDTDDVVQRLLALAQIFGVAVMAVNADDALDSRSSAGFAAAYAALRLVLVCQYIRARRVALARDYATRSAIGFGAAAAVWLVSALTPAPARFLLWALALAVDLGTPVLTARHTAQVPPDAAHLPERFGLFTIILLGESLVAVMKGMKTQEVWSVAAASSALLGMTMAFTLWWWYFDGVTAAGERHVRTKRDARLLHIWTYAHLPLYLGIGVAAVGVEHVIHLAPEGSLHGHEPWLLCGALATAMAAVTTIAATRHGAVEEDRVGPPLATHYATALATLLMAATNPLLHPALFLLGVAALCVLQLLLSLRSLPAQATQVATAPHDTGIRDQRSGGSATVA